MDDASSACTKDEMEVERTQERSTTERQLQSNDSTLVSPDSSCSKHTTSPEQQGDIVEIKLKEQRQKNYFNGCSTFVFSRRTPEFVVQKPKKVAQLKLEVIPLHYHKFRVETTFSRPRMHIFFHIFHAHIIIIVIIFVLFSISISISISIIVNLKKKRIKRVVPRSHVKFYRSVCEVDVTAYFLQKEIQRDVLLFNQFKRASPAMVSNSFSLSFPLLCFIHSSIPYFFFRSLK